MTKINNDLTIEQRMIRFLEGQNHVTPLDGHVHQPSGVKMADYLFFDRRAVVELKNFSVDPKEKILNYAKPLMESVDFPLLYGEYNLATAITGMPGGKDQLNRIFSKATTMVEGVLRQAKKQIISSKKFLNLDPKTPGILLVLNENVDSIPASQLAERFSYWLRGGSEKNPSRFSEIDFVIFIQTTYRLKNEAGKLLPAFIIYNDSTNRQCHDVENDIQIFLREWAQFQGHNYGSTANFSNLEFEPNLPPQSDPKTVQDMIEARYRASRHLKNMTEEQFIKYGTVVMKQMLSMVIRGEERPSKSDSMKFLEQFTELLEESRLRGFDLKKITSRMK